jgi:hypothetical protein
MSRFSYSLLAVSAVVASIVFYSFLPQPGDAAEEYARFTQEYAEKPFAEQHLAAHKKGLELYTELGIAGFGVCDESFAFGCYHAFFGGAIADKGVSVVAELADACRTRFGANSTGCEHGIGHGLIEHLGREQLAEALSLCDASGQKNPLFGCTGGVFMEYNSAITFPNGDAVVDVRKPDAHNLRAPCTDVAEKYRASCYFEIGLWWKQVLGTDADIGAMCKGAGSRDEQNACSRGWGTVVAEDAHHDPGAASVLCEKLGDVRLADECRMGVALRLFGAGNSDAGRQMCDRMSGEQTECLALP